MKNNPTLRLFYSFCFFLLLITTTTNAADVLAVIEQTAGRIDFYDTQSHRKLGGTKIGDLPHEIALSPDGKTAYVTNFGLQDYDETIGTPGDTISVIDTQSLTTTKTINDLGVDQILYSAISPNGKYIVAPAVWNNQTLIIDANTGKIIKRIVTGVDPVNVVIDNQSQYAYVSNARNAHVSKINLTTLAIEDINTKSGPNGLGIIIREGKTELTNNLVGAELRFGALLPLSGKDNKIGRDIMLGYEFWRDAINHNGGLKIGNSHYKVKIVYQDTQSQEKHFPLLIKKMVNESAIKGLLAYHATPNLDEMRAANLPIYPFMVALDNYDKLGSTIFFPFTNHQQLEDVVTPL